MMAFSPVQWMGRALARFLSRERPQEISTATTRPDLLFDALEPGDVLLVEGTSRISGAIKYLTQSTWSHAALYVGDAIDGDSLSSERRSLVEADLNDGVRAVPLGLYAHYHTRICRPVGLTPAENEQVIRYAIERLGHQYDLRNIFDLARYLIRNPPVPGHLKRRMLTFGSGDPTRAICSSLIAQAFQSIRYPILPAIDYLEPAAHHPPGYLREIYRIRHHSMYAPRDFDVSPFFDVVKPRVVDGFNFRAFDWFEDEGSDTSAEH